MQNENNAIEVRNVVKQFKYQYDRANTLKGMLVYRNRGKKELHTVLNGLTFDIKKGETVALVGTNGCGKSTMLKLMTRIIYPNKGTVETNGKLTSLLELGAGFHPDFTGRENIYFNASIFGLTKEDIEKRMADIISFSELGEFIDQPVRTYSSGMYMRLAFSIAINVDAEILLIDEILAVGDQYFQDKCFRKLEELRDSSKTIVIVSHSLETVKKLCERAIWIYKGQVKEDGKPDVVIPHYLDRIAKDHLEQKKKALENGTEQYQTLCFVDHPVYNVPIKQSDGLFEFNGWTVSNYENRHHKGYIDDVEITQFEFKDDIRADVYTAYYEDFAGFIDSETAGWKMMIDANTLSVGDHRVSYKCVDENGNVLVEKSVYVTIVE